MFKPEEIRDLRKDEELRGRKTPPDRDKLREARGLRRQWSAILKTMTWPEVVTALSLQEGTQMYEQFHQIWQEYRGGASADAKPP